MNFSSFYNLHSDGSGNQNLIFGCHIHFTLNPFLHCNSETRKPQSVSSYIRKNIFRQSNHYHHNSNFKLRTRTLIRYLHRKSFNSEMSSSFLLKQLTFDVIPIKSSRTRIHEKHCYRTGHYLSTSG